jgi:hypothetical protein
MTDIIKAILKINPNAEVSVSGDDINTITWHNGTTPISKADIEAKMVEVQADYDAKQYQRDRVYPSLKNNLICNTGIVLMVLLLGKTQ